MRLPRIYDHFTQGQVFTVDEARTALNITGNTLRKRLCELSTRGYIKSVRQGLYQLTHPGENIPCESISPFVLACKITPWCYIGFKSALQFHSGILPSPGEMINVVSQRKFNSFEYEGVEYFWCQSPDTWGLEHHTISQGQWKFNIAVTDFEKSILDCLKRPMHSPSLDELSRLCIAVNRKPDIEKLLQYTSNAQVAAVFNRVGYFLEVMQNHWDIKTETLNSFYERVSRRQTDWNIVEPPGTHGYREERWRIQFGKNSLDNPAADC